MHGRRLRVARLPVGNQHPRIEGRANNAAALNNGPNLVIGELTLPGNNCTAIVVTRNHGSTKQLQSLPEGIVGKVCQVEDDAKLFKHRQQLPSKRR